MLLPAVVDPGHLRKVVLREACRRSLMAFVRMFWRTVEPRADFCEGWWLEALAIHLEAVTDGKIKRLICNVPPGAMKSLMTNCFWPAWEWGPMGRPSTRYVAVSYSSGLTERDNQRMSQIVLSPLYQELWGDTVSATENKIKFQNTATGWKLASSTSGISTGERGDRVICLPFNSLILTQNGWLPIGLIVERRLPVCVAGWSGTAIEWQEIEAYERNPAGRLVEIDYGSGVLRCTDDHPVWVEGRGYTAAGCVRPGDRVLRCLQQTDEASTVSNCEDQAADLFPGMSAHLVHEQGGIHLQDMQQDVPGQAGAAGPQEVLLQGVLLSGTRGGWTAARSGGDPLCGMRQDSGGYTEPSEAFSECKDTLLQTMSWQDEVHRVEQSEVSSWRTSDGQDQDLYLSGMRQGDAQTTVAEPFQARCSLLLQTMCGLRQWSRFRTISEYVEQVLQGRDQRTGRSRLSAMSVALGAGDTKASRAPHRLRYSELESWQSDLAMQGLSSAEGSCSSPFRCEPPRVASATIRAVHYLGDVPCVTYNLRVAPHHNYFADGILCHNCDDPNNIQNVESDDIRLATNRWLKEIMPSRLTQPKDSAIIVIQQRTHEDDATGVLMESEATEWEHLVVPMRYEPQRHCKTSIGWSDPRTQEGELFWPERFPSEEVDRLEKELGPYASSGQLQQLPSPRGGGIIKVDWWLLWPPEDDGSGEGWVTAYGPNGEPLVDAKGNAKRMMMFPDWLYLLVSLDTAYTAKEENDWSACTVWGLFSDRSGNAKIMLVEAWRARLELHALAQKVIDTCKRRKADLLLVEDRAAGHSVSQEIRRVMTDGEWVVRLWNPKRTDKVSRLMATEPLFAGGLVYAPARKWARTVIDEVASVPRGKYDDLADTVSMALLYLRQIGLAKLATEGEGLSTEDEDSIVARKLRGNRVIAESYGL